MVHGSLEHFICSRIFPVTCIQYVCFGQAAITLVACWLRVTIINLKINQKSQEKTLLIKPPDNWMINFVACTRVCFGLPGGYCCVLYPTVGHSSLGHNISHSVSLTYVKRARVRSVATRRSLRKETAHQLNSHVYHNAHHFTFHFVTANITELLPWLHTSGSNHNQKVIYNNFKWSEMSFVTVIW